MNVLNKLTIKHLKMNKKRTIVTIIGIMLSTALMVGIGLLFASFREYIITQIKSSSGDYHANIEKVDYDDIDIILSNKNVDKVSYRQLIGFAEINSDEYHPYLYIAGANDNYLNGLTVKSGRLPLNNKELVVTDFGQYKINDTIKLECGYLISSGMNVYDNLMHDDSAILEVTHMCEYTVVGLIQQDIYESYEAPGYSAFTQLGTSEYPYGVFISYKKVKNVYDKTEEILREIGKTGSSKNNDVQYNSSLLSIYAESKYDNFNGSILKIMFVMLGLVSIGCIIVIYNSFAISVMERKKQFGLFASVGATKSQIRKTVFFEALIVGFIGIVLGIVASILGISVVLAIISKLLDEVFVYSLKLAIYPLFIIVPVIFMIVVIFISAFIPSFIASRVSPIRSIRQNDDIKIKSKKIKSNWIVNKLYGVVGDLAIKNMQRNKKKYRVTVISLVISIVMFVGFSSFFKYTIEGATDYLSDPDYDIALSFDEENVDTVLKNFGSNIKMIRNANEVLDDTLILNEITIYANGIDSKYFTDEYKSLLSDDESFVANFHDVSIIAFNDEDYNELKERYHINSNRPILINLFKAFSYATKDGNIERKYIEGNIFNKDFNSKLSPCMITDYELFYSSSPQRFDGVVCNSMFEDMYLTTEVPFGLQSYLSNLSLNVIVNQEMYNEIIDSAFNEEESLSYMYRATTSLYIKTSSNDKLDKMINEVFTDESTFSYYNVDKEMQMQRNLILVIKILVYGFVGLITLIGVTSVINTINTSISLRRREFAMLRSIGLTSSLFSKMIRLESLFFGLKSLMYGLPISFLFIVLLHYSMEDLVSYDHLLISWSSVLIAVVGVFVIVFLSMMYSTRKIKKENILDVIREENI